MNIKKTVKILFYKDVVKDALLVSLVVGTILNIVNQGDIFINLEFEKISILKVILTYIVPYLVSTYSSVRTRLSFDIEKECKNLT